MEKILIVDDEESMRDFLTIMFRKEGYEVSTAANGEEAINLLNADIFDIVITDIRMPKIGGLDLLKAVKEISPETIVLVITAHASTDTALEAMKNGAYDYITKPFKIDEIKLIIRNALEKRHLREENLLLKRKRTEVDTTVDFLNIIGRSEKMNRIFDLVKKISDTRSNVLIHGESGTGKELIARAIHLNSKRSNKPFVTVNCSAIPETLLESELFGHMKGSFTGAYINKEGLFEIANEGTIFLDEIGDTPLSIQVKLLRVLQEKEFRRIGGTKDIKVDVRIIAATNKDLEKEIMEGKFREDLYYRLDVIPVHLPPLRERIEDIPLLVSHFINKFTHNYGERGNDIPDGSWDGVERRKNHVEKYTNGISPEAMDILARFEWKGNVRELENVMERVVALKSGDTITDDDVKDALQRPYSIKEGIPSEISADGIDLEGFIGDIEKKLIISALQKSNGVKKKAAELLKLNFRAFRYKLEKYGIR